MRMRAFLALGLVLAGLVLGVVSGHRPPAARADSHGVEVTSLLDTGLAGGAACPHASACTLRRAIEIANADVLPGVFTITFSPSVFPPDAPASIAVGNVSLPNITRSDVAIVGTGSGVVLVGASSSLTAVINGLTVTGNGFSLRGLRIHKFTGSCVVVTGTDATIGEAGAGNVFGGCKLGVGVSGSGASIAGNLVGFTPDGAADQVDTGIAVSAGDVVVGGPATSPGSGNTIGFADAAIYIGSGASDSFTGVTIERNNIGRRPSGEPAPVGAGVILSQPSSVSTVLGNDIHNAATGIRVAADSGTVTVARNRFASNTFEAIGGMAIDLAADGIRNPNDEGDTDLGPNTLLNHPVISRATQSRVTGTACGGCTVQVYLAAHTAGGGHDYGRIPLAGGVVTADAAGQFTLENPAASAGDWLTALATDANGNTSEFGPSTRVGSGAVLCGNVQLNPGWNHIGYFGSESASLFDSFPGDSAGVITAAYRAIDGTGEWERWFSNTAAGRTLHTVQPGESYWVFATAPASLPGGFSISFPVPVQLKAGPNDLTYLGASAPVLDALGSLNGAFRHLYRFDSAGATWLRFGDPTVPSWAQDFTGLEACSTYQLWLDAPATLVPLQP